MVRTTGGISVEIKLLYTEPFIEQHIRWWIHDATDVKTFYRTKYTHTRIGHVKPGNLNMSGILYQGQYLL